MAQEVRRTKPGFGQRDFRESPVSDRTLSPGVIAQVCPESLLAAPDASCYNVIGWRARLASLRLWDSGE